MNAAFLVLTALAAGDTGHVAPAPAAAIPAASSCASTISGGCGTCCDVVCCEKESLLSRLRNKLHGLRHRGNDCCDSCAPSCGCESLGSKLKGRLRGLFHRGGDCCNSCAPTCGEGCATGGCNGHGAVISGDAGHGTIINAPPASGTSAPEHVAPPKEGGPAHKMPAGPKDGAKPADAKKVQLTPRPLTSPILNLTPTSGRSPF